MTTNSFLHTMFGDAITHFENAAVILRKINVEARIQEMSSSENLDRLAPVSCFATGKRACLI